MEKYYVCEDAHFLVKVENNEIFLDSEHRLFQKLKPFVDNNVILEDHHLVLHPNHDFVSFEDILQQVQYFANDSYFETIIYIPYIAQCRIGRTS